MKDEPDIVKELREAEKLRLLHGVIQSTFEGLEAPDESIDETSNQTSYMIESREKRTKTDELRSVEEKYRTIFENYAVAITLADNKEHIVSWNKYTEELLNITQNELYLKSVNSLYPPEEWQKIRVENVRQKGIKYRMETRMIKKNKGYIDVELSLCILRGKEGKPVGSVGIIKDITQLKETERELKVSEERYRTIFENSAVSIMLTDEKERIISWNKFTENLLGICKEDLYLKPVESLYPEEEWHKIRSENIRKKGLQHHMETKIFKKNNEIIDVDLSLSVLKNHEGKVVGSIGVIQDITERKKAEEKIRYQADLLNNVSEAIISTDIDFKIKSWNKAAEQIYGWKEEEVLGKLGKDVAKLSSPSGSKKEIIKQVLKNGKWEGEVLQKHKNNRILNIYASVTLIKDSAGMPIGAVAVNRDITDRKKAEKELQDSKEKFRNLAELLPEIVFEMDSRGILSFVNKQSFKITGYCIEDFKKGFQAINLLIPEDRERAMRNIRRVMNGEKISTQEYIAQRKDGTMFPINVYSSPILKDGQPVGLRGIIVDISARKKIENELKIAHEKLKMVNIELEEKIKERTAQIQQILHQKDEFITQLGHDLKTPLTPLVNLLPLIEKKEKDPEKREILQAIIRNVGYMKNLVMNTLELARLNSPNTQFDFENINLFKDVNKVIENNKLIFDKKNIKLVNNVSNDIIVRADKLCLEELLNNLFDNAVKHIPDAGRITIDAKQNKNYITVSIKDTGVGMTEEQLSKVFEEFYKADLSRHDFGSSGLGMPICKRIVEKHGGRIWAESKGPGKGSTFYFILKSSI